MCDVLLSGTNKIEYFTQFHTKSNNNQKEELKAEEHPNTANPDCYEYEFNGECDFLLMGCDGVWESKSNEEMCEWVYRKLEEAPDRSQESLKTIVSDLLNELISPNHQQTGKCLLLSFAFQFAIKCLTLVSF